MPVDIYQRFLGTDFTYADLGFVRLHEMYKLLGEEELNGVQAYIAACICLRLPVN